MSKYEGIAKADVIVSESKADNHSNKKRSKFKGDFLFRVIFAGILVAAPFILKLIDLPFTKLAAETVKTAVTYDMSKSSEKYGEISFVEKIKELIAKYQKSGNLSEI